MSEYSNKLRNEGVLTINNVIKSDEFTKLKKGYLRYWDEINLSNEKDDLESKRKNLEKIVDFCPEIFNILENADISKTLKDYLGDGFKITGIYGTRSKPQNFIPNEKDISEIENSNYNILLYHHDQDGRQIKLIIPLSEINENQNCLEYAVGSNKMSWLDKIVVKFLNLFGYYKNWRQPIINHLFNLLKKKNNYQFYNENEIKKKYKIKSVIANIGDVYLFDTCGYHRQKIGNEKTDFSKLRETIFVDIMPNNEWFKKKKMVMNFKSLSEDNQLKMSKYL